MPVNGLNSQKKLPARAKAHLVWAVYSTLKSLRKNGEELANR
jgi:hypothetical protein